MKFLVPCLCFIACADTAFHQGGEESEQEDCKDGVVGDTRCTDDGNFQRCQDGTWVSGLCENNDCSGGECDTNACPNGNTVTCGDDGTIHTCRSDVGGYVVTSCEGNNTCVDNSCQPRVCVPDFPYCQGNSAYQCNHNGTSGSLIKTCPDGDVCSSGDCIGACDLAASSYSFVGCDYYWVDTDNDAANDALQSDIVVGNPSETLSVTVTVSEHNGDDWVTVETKTISPRGVMVIPTTCTGGDFLATCQDGNIGPDKHPEDTTIETSLAFRVESTQPIFAYQFNSDDLGGSASSSGATILMPKAALDRQYYALTMPQSGSDRSWVEVVGTQEDTSVTIRVSDATVAGGGIGALSPGGSLTVSLNDGDVLQLASSSNGDDLSGTFIEAGQPVAVFAGAECTRVEGGTCSAGSGQGDHIEETMIPIVAWGTSFVAAHVRHPQSSASQGQATWKVVAWKDGTTVTFDAGTDVGNLPSTQTLQAGEVFQFATTGTNGHFFVEATEAIQMMQVLHGETASIMVVPQEQYLPSYVFLAPPFFDDTLTITRPVGVTIELDDSGISSVWTEAGGGYEATWMDDLVDGSHEITTGGSDKSLNAGIQLVGVDVNCSYGYLGGLNVERINPIE